LVKEKRRSVVSHLPSMYEILAFIPEAQKKKKE
jgi:hypothetical protein